MAGNLPVTLTTFETELQAKINTVGGGTSIEDIISYYRAGENIPTINNTALTAEVQSRLNAVSSSTTAEEFLTLAASFGKISNTNQSDLQSALLAIADIPTNSELTTALNPIVTSAELAPLAKSSELVPLATSTNVSDSEANILSAVNLNSAAKLQAIVKPSIFPQPSTSNPLLISPPDADSFIKLTLLAGQNGNDVFVNGILVGGVNLLSSSMIFNNIPTNQTDASTTPNRFTISANFAAYAQNTSFFMQHLGAVIEPIIGGRGEDIEITILSGNSNLVYAYEVWK